MDWAEVLKIVGPAIASGFGAFLAVKVELAELRTKMVRAETDIQQLFTLHSERRIHK